MQDARRYIEAQERFYSKNPDFVREEMYRLLGEVNGKSILDLGCGGGSDVQCLIEKGAAVVGLDASSHMINIATERFQIPDSAFVQADISKPLPFQDGQFDRVFARYSLHYVSQLDPLFSELHRVLKTDGFLVACVAHPLLGFIAKGCKDYFDQRDFELDLYDSAVTITESSHTFVDYFSKKVLSRFDLVEFTEPIPKASQKNENAFKARIAESLIFKMRKRS